MYLARVVGLAALLGAAPLGAQARVERNVVDGMYSGLALLLDVHRPARPNGYGVVVINGSGFLMPLDWGPPPGGREGLKDGPGFRAPLLRAGYTVFSINHRAAPRFQYPAPVEDAQRAVRFVREHAREFGVDSERVGALGSSSGGYVAAMLAVLDAPGAPADPDPVNRRSACVTAAVAVAASSPDLRLPAAYLRTANMTLFMGMVLPDDPQAGRVATRAFREAAPSTHASAGDAPLLLVHGDSDQTVPYQASELLEGAMRGAGAEVRLIRVPGGPHSEQMLRDAPEHPEWPDFQSEIAQWFDRHLRRAPPAARGRPC